MRASRMTETSASGVASDTGSFRDEEMAQSVRTVERKQTWPTPKAREWKTPRAPIATLESREPTAPSHSVSPAPASTPSVESLKAAINAPQQQGRSDERPALLANVLKTDTSATLRRVAAWGLAQFGESQVGV